MFERFHRKSATATVAALMAALGVGGIAVAQNNSSTTPSAPPPATDQGSGGGGTVDTPESATEKPDANEANDKPDANEANEPPESANDPADTESGSEQPGDDGPGGHADEPGNPNADHQATGQE